MDKKMEMYIYREQEYRETIRILNEAIDQNSKKPFLLPKETTDETLDLENGVKLELQRPKDEDAEEQQRRMNDDVYRDQKKVKEMNADIERID